MECRQESNTPMNAQRVPYQRLSRTRRSSVTVSLCRRVCVQSPRAAPSFPAGRHEHMNRGEEGGGVEGRTSSTAFTSAEQSRRSRTTDDCQPTVALCSGVRPSCSIREGEERNYPHFQGNLSSVVEERRGHLVVAVNLGASVH